MRESHVSTQPRGDDVDVITNRDYDTACWGLSAHTDDLGFWNLFNNFASTSASNRAGYKAVSEAYIKEMPMMSIDALAESIASQPSVKDIAKTVQSMVHYDKVWIEK